MEENKKKKHKLFVCYSWITGEYKKNKPETWIVLVNNSSGHNLVKRLFLKFVEKKTNFMIQPGQLVIISVFSQLSSASLGVLRMAESTSKWLRLNYWLYFNLDSHIFWHT